MFGFDPFGIKRRRLAREAALEAQRKRLRDRVAPVPGVVQLLPPGRSVSSRSSSPPILAAHDPLHSLNPLNPLSPLSVYNQVDGYAGLRNEPVQVDGYAGLRHEPEPARSHCSPSVSDDSWSRSSSSGSDYGCSSSSYDSGSSSSSDSSSSSSSSDSSSY